MGWSESVRREIYRRQKGLCAVCGKRLPFNNCVIHHVINRCKNGKSTANNGEARHPACENYMHANFKYGNLPRMFRGKTTIHVHVLTRKSKKTRRKPRQKR